MRQFRLIYDTAATGKRNMAVDETILAAVIEGLSLPTLRFYAWEPACLSLGYGQSWHDADLYRLEANGWQIVRRITGGRAILHTDELTYSLALPAGHSLAEGSILESYQRISQAFMRGLQQLGLNLKADRMEKRVRAIGPVCFEVPSHYEITTQDGRKLMGSAQYRRKGAVLQHGSLPLCGDLARICDALQFDDEDQRGRAMNKVRRRAAAVEDAMGHEHIAWHDAADALVWGFQETFGIEFMQDQLSEVELNLAEELERDVYGSDAWTRRR